MSKVDEILEHYGVKGMKWGVRKDQSSSSGPTAVETKTIKGHVITTGGKGHEPSEDALNAAIGKQKAKKSGLASLSNKELQAVVTRMNLEQQYSRLIDQRAYSSAGQKFVSELFRKNVQPELEKAADDYTTKKVAKVFSK